METHRIAPFFSFPFLRRRAAVVETEAPPIHPWILGQIQHYAQNGFPAEIGIKPAEYIKDVVRYVEKVVGNTEKTDIKKLLVIDPRVRFDRQLELFRFSTLLNNPSQVVNLPGIREPHLPYAILLDSLPSLDPKELYELSFFTAWLPPGIRALTGNEGLAYLNSHPDIASSNHNRYFVGSEYFGKPLKTVKDHNGPVFDREYPWVKRLPSQVPLCRIP